MTISSLYPVLMSRDVARASAFYRDHLDCETTFETDWYVSLRASQFEIAILAFDHPTVPPTHQKPPQGVLINVEVANVDDYYARMVERDGLVPIVDIRDEDFGQRHFIVAAPDGVLLDVIQPIEPSAAFMQAYAAEGANVHP